MERAEVAHSKIRALVMLVSTRGRISSRKEYCLVRLASLNLANTALSTLNWRLVREKSLSIFRIRA